MSDDVKLTHGQIEQVIALLRTMTTGPYSWGTHSSKTHLAAARWVGKSIRQNARTDMDCVFVPDATGDASLFIAVTGNGPASPANAHGLAVLLTAAPMLCRMAHAALDTEELLQTLYRHEAQFKAHLTQRAQTEPDPAKAAAFADVLNWLD